MAKKKNINEKQSSPATDLPLFYQDPKPLDKEKHGNMSLSDKLDFSFAREVNAVPINIIEIPKIMQTYPIAFAATNPSTPMAILGLRDGENLFVDKDGNWLENTYIPAYVRRYPFIFAQDSSGKKLTLCIDTAKGIIVKNKKRPLFKNDGSATDMVQQALEFCKSYQSAAQQTLAFSQAVDESGILEDRHAEVKLSDGQTMSLSGFRQVSERKLMALPDDKILNWYKKYWMRAVYAQLLSTANWQNIYQLLEKKHKKESPTKKKK